MHGLHMLEHLEGSYISDAMAFAEIEGRVAIVHKKASCNQQSAYFWCCIVHRNTNNGLILRCKITAKSAKSMRHLECALHFLLLIHSNDILCCLADRCGSAGWAVMSMAIVGTL